MVFLFDWFRMSENFSHQIIKTKKRRFTNIKTRFFEKTIPIYINSHFGIEHGDGPDCGQHRAFGA